MTTQTLVFTEHGGPETQALIDRPRPVPGRGEVAIEVKAAGVNPADWKIRAGLMGARGQLPAAMGLEASGIITSVGEGVEAFSVGDAVLGLAAKGHGTFARHTVLDATQTVLKPEELSFADAAALPVAGATAYDVTHQIELEPGQTMLILGAGGGIGLMAAQIGKVHEFVTIGVANAGKKELVESTGATFVEAGDVAADRVRTIAPEGVDLIIDLVGGQALRDIAGIAKNPSVIVSAADPVTAADLGGAAVQRTREGIEKITGVAQYGLVDAQVRERFDLEHAMDAIALVEGGHAAGKVIIEP
ncbi:MAG: NADP-dependent oxidoreductase [Leucobacter sp.]